MAISLGQLDLEALKNYLKIVQGFRTVNDPSDDTEHVDGVPSNLIATIAQVENEIVQEILGRQAVDYALNLVKIDGDKVQFINGDTVLTNEEGLELKEAAIQASRSTANDMRALRNEMYHLKRDMIKTGAMSYDPVYDGYIDPFLSGMELFTKDILEVNNIVNDEVFIENGDVEAYITGQYAALKSDGELITIEPVKSSSGTTASITVGDGAVILSKTPDEISKSYGVYDKGRFIFGNNGEGLSALTDNEVNMIYKDGPDRIKVAELNQMADTLGFASTIMVPAELDDNYLNAISVSLRIIGNPGSCYLELYNYNEAGNYGDPIAVSNRLESGQATSAWYSYKFKFDNEILLEKGAMYLLVIKANGTDSFNMWYVGGFTEICNENKHQDTYKLTTEGSLKKESPDIITNQVYDMFMGLYTTETRPIKLNYSQKGIYTGTFETENNTATRVRVSFNPRVSNKYYNVIVKGRTLYEEIINGTLTDTFQYGHTVWADGEQSAPEYAYDFIFEDPVTFIEFQIIFNCPEYVGEQNFEALYAVVVSTDNAYLKEEEEGEIPNGSGH